MAMNYHCNIIRDLMPLVKDSVASNESIKTVREHIQTCEECNNIFREIEDNKQMCSNINSMHDPQDAFLSVKKKIQKRRIKTTVFVTLGVVLLLFIQYLMVGAGVFSLFTIDPNKIESSDLSTYTDNLMYLRNGEATDRYFSEFLIFPDNIPESAVLNNYYYKNSDVGFDGICQLVLSYSLPDDLYVQEVKRLQSISYTPADVKQKVWVDDEVFGRTAYITIYTQYQGYEYAIADDESNQIVYVFSTTSALYDLPLNEEFLPPENYAFEGKTAGLGFNIYYIDGSGLYMDNKY